MSKGTIQLCYRKIIDSTSTKLWEQYVFQDTYMEFFMKAQYYNQDGKYQTYQELIDNIPNASQLPFLVSTAAHGYILQLKGIVPDITNAFGKLCLPFEQYQFDIVHSHISDKQQHKIAIYFYSNPIVWLDSIGDQILISYNTNNQNDTFETDLLRLQPYLSIISFKPVPNV